MNKLSLSLSPIVGKLLTITVLAIFLVTGCGGGISSFQSVVPSPISAETALPVMTATTVPLPLTIYGCLFSDACPTAKLISSYFPKDETRYTNTQYYVDIYYEDEVRFFYGWCAIDRPTLEDNRAHLEYVFTIDGVSYADKLDHGFTSMQDNNDPNVTHPCYSIGGVLSGWKAGESHEIVIGAKFLQDIFDGFTTSAAGDHLFIYMVNPNNTIPTHVPPTMIFTPTRTRIAGVGREPASTNTPVLANNTPIPPGNTPLPTNTSVVLPPPTNTTEPPPPVICDPTGSISFTYYSASDPTDWAEIGLYDPPDYAYYSGGISTSGETIYISVCPGVDYLYFVDNYLGCSDSGSVSDGGSVTLSCP